MPEFPISSARILLVSQIQGGQLLSLPPVRYAYGEVWNVPGTMDVAMILDVLESR